MTDLGVLTLNNRLEFAMSLSIKTGPPAKVNWFVVEKKHWKLIAYFSDHRTFSGVGNLHEAGAIY